MTISFAHMLHFFIELSLLFAFSATQHTGYQPPFSRRIAGVICACIPIVLYTEDSVISNVWLRLSLRIVCYTVAFLLLKGFGFRHALLCALVCLSIFSANTNIWLTSFCFPISRDLVTFVSNAYLNSVITSLLKYGCCTILFLVVMKTADIDSVPEDDIHIHVVLGLILASEQYIKKSMNEIYISGLEPSANLSVYSIILQLFLLLLLIVYVRYSNSLRQRKIINLQQMSSNYQLETLKLRQRNEEDLRSLRHDMKNHILVLDHYLNGEEKDELAAAKYVHGLLDELETIRPQIETGHILLNGLFAKKCELARRNGIQMDILFDGRPLAQIADIDLCTIFANLWDNAIEACERVAPPELRKIVVRGRPNNQQYFFKMSNSFSGRIAFLGGLPVTSKLSTDCHGYGLRNVRRVVEKYGGTVTVDTIGAEFSVCIMLPLDR